MFQQEVEPNGSEKVFTAEELELMQKLGLSQAQVKALMKAAEKKPTRRTSKRTEFLQEYYLQHTDICSLCGGKRLSYFKMLRDYSNGVEYLRSIPITEEEFSSCESKVEKKEVLHLTCTHCTENLSKLSVENLVQLCIHLQRRVIK